MHCAELAYTCLINWETGMRGADQAILPRNYGDTEVSCLLQLVSGIAFILVLRSAANQGGFVFGGNMMDEDWPEPALDLLRYPPPPITLTPFSPAHVASVSALH